MIFHERESQLSEYNKTPRETLHGKPLFKYVIAPGNKFFYEEEELDCQTGEYSLTKHVIEILRFHQNKNEWSYKQTAYDFDIKTGKLTKRKDFFFQWNEDTLNYALSERNAYQFTGTLEGIMHHPLGMKVEVI